MKKALIILLFFPVLSQAQVIISSGTALATSATDIAIITSGNIVNNSGSADFSQSKLYVELIGGSQTLGGNFNFVSLKLSGAGGDKTITNTITVTQSMDFTQGWLVPSPGKILYTGAEGGITGGNTNSFTKGFFYSQGSGNRLFPIGTGSTYAPATLLGVTTTDEVGMQVVGSDAGLVKSDEINEIETTQYWEVSTAAIDALNAKVNLSLNGLDAAFLASPNGAATVVQGTAVSSTASDLGYSSISATEITSRRGVSASILAIGLAKEINLRVHDIITPNGDVANDELFIENIDKFDSNTVTLLDRYGVLVKKWQNFKNYSDPLDPNTDGFDFKKLGAGNYICLVEYGNNGDQTKKASQMVTVLKAN